MMVESKKVMILDEMRDEEFHGLVTLECSKKYESLYACFYTQNTAKKPIVLELATDPDKIRDIRNFLTDILNKIDNRYGFETKEIITEVKR